VAARGGGARALEQAGQVGNSFWGRGEEEAHPRRLFMVVGQRSGGRPVGEVAGVRLVLGEAPP
jgi:hypothetical protein